MMMSSDENSLCQLILGRLMFSYHSKCLPDISKQELRATNVTLNAPFVSAACSVCTSNLSGKRVYVHPPELQTAELVKPVLGESLTCKKESRVCR